ncbi:unnamed protein product [Bemisia tabaci]|uniref:Uncharacterized protein n=1 Tax=Bemisia tabaci TaxID=7038 RepID=A0A9P0AF90_BEMTA|nr:unnamed protein product [Bemisia tabaci]
MITDSSPVPTSLLIKILCVKVCDVKCASKCLIWTRGLATIRTFPLPIDISSQYGEGTTEGSVKVDDLEVEYTPCTTTRKNEPP